MRLGVSLYEGTIHADGTRLVDAIRRWRLQANRFPTFVPIWNPLSKAGTAPVGGDFPASLMSAVYALGVEPMIYMTSMTNADTEAERGYESYIAGDHDVQLEAWATAAASYGERIIVRFDQEMNADWAPWGAKPKWQFRQAFAHVRDVIKTIAPLTQFYFCPTGKPKAIEEYYPGDSDCDFVGFDCYSRREDQSIPEQWNPLIRACQQVSNKRIIVGEFGRRSDLPNRAAWLEGLGRVDGVAIANYFDMDVPSGSWSMTPNMRKLYGKL